MIGVLILAAGVAAVIAGVVLFADNDEDDEPAPAAQQTNVPLFSPSTPDELAIEELARRSVEALPLGQWPALYDDFSPEFQARCTRADFEAGGEAQAQEQGPNLQLLGYLGLNEVVIAGDSATAVIVGEVRGQSQYTIGAAFVRALGAWKLAPAEGTAGCQAFNRLSG